MQGLKLMFCLISYFQISKLLSHIFSIFTGEAHILHLEYFARCIHTGIAEVLLAEVLNNTISLNSYNSSKTLKIISCSEHI